MNCPVCQDVALVMSDRQGVEIDYCPKCRGVWLDRGELDKIIEKSASAESPRAPEPEYQSRPDAPRRDNYDRNDEYNRKKKRKGGFLSDMFDFD
ncbi:MAG: zf-TFIIB domain-containing protein [Pyrinomonadaceae bacterium]